MLRGVTRLASGSMTEAFNAARPIIRKCGKELLEQGVEYGVGELASHMGGNTNIGGVSTRNNIGIAQGISSGKPSNIFGALVSLCTTVAQGMQSTTPVQSRIQSASMTPMFRSVSSESRAESRALLTGSIQSVIHATQTGGPVDYERIIETPKHAELTAKEAGIIHNIFSSKAVLPIQNDLLQETINAQKRTLQEVTPAMLAATEPFLDSKNDNRFKN